MMDTILALIPVFGLWVLFFTIALGGLAIPLPGSMLVLASGSFAASGDIDLTYAMASALAGYVAGDQTAFRIARMVGPTILKRFRRSKKAEKLIDRAEIMLEKRGVMAIFLSRTIVTPMAPWMSYLSGAAGMSWLAFSLASLVGASIWIVAYSLTGYYFADRIYELASLASDGVGFIAAFAVMILSALWLRMSWKRYKQKRFNTDQREAEGKDHHDDPV